MSSPAPRRMDLTARATLRAGATRVLIVDGHPIVRRGLVSLLERQHDLSVCGEAEGAAEAMKLISEFQPQLVLLELPLRNGSGLDLVKELSSAEPAPKVLVFSHCDERLFAERVLRAGAMGFLSKTASLESILTAIRRVLADRIYLSEPMAEQMVSRAVRGNGAEKVSPVSTLSDRELQVFELLGKGVPTRQIAQHLVLSPKTIETYRENIKLKLNLRNGSELTRHAVQWVLERS